MKNVIEGGAFMGSFFAALTTVGVMLFYAVPGYLLVKTKLVGAEGISNFAKLFLSVAVFLQTDSWAISPFISFYIQSMPK